MLSVSCLRHCLFTRKVSLLLRRTFVSRKSSFSDNEWVQKSQQQRDLENSNNLSGRVAKTNKKKHVHQFSFFEKAVLMFSPASESRHLRPRGSLCQQLRVPRLPFKHSRIISLSLLLIKPQTPPILPFPPPAAQRCPLPVRGDMAQCSDYSSLKILLFWFEKPVMAPAKGWICQASASKMLFLKVENEISNPIGSNKSSGARGCSVASTSHLLKMFGTVFSTKCEKGVPRLLLPHTDMERWNISAPFLILAGHLECWTKTFLKQRMPFSHLIFVVFTPTCKGASKRPFPGVLIKNICLWQMRQVWPGEFRLESPVHFGLRYLILPGDPCWAEEEATRVDIAVLAQDLLQ